jgi:hypothetical protein
MTALWLAAPAISFLLLGAHFLREGSWVLVAACVALLALLAVRRRWAQRLVQAALVLGALEWVWTALILVQQRTAQGQPWTRLALILGVVALWTLASAVAMQRVRVPKRDL